MEDKNHTYQLVEQEDGAFIFFDNGKPIIQINETGIASHTNSRVATSCADCQNGNAQYILIDRGDLVIFCANHTALLAADGEQIILKPGAVTLVSYANNCSTTTSNN